MARPFVLCIVVVAAVAAVCAPRAAATVLSHRMSRTLTHGMPQTRRTASSMPPQWGATAHDAANTNHIVAPGVTTGNWTRNFDVAAGGWTPKAESLMAASASGCVLVAMKRSKSVGLACLNVTDGSTQWLTPLPKIPDNLSSAPVVLVDGSGNVIVVGIASGNQMPTVVYTLDGKTGDILSASVFDTLLQEDSLDTLAAAIGDGGRLYVGAGLTIGVVQDAKLVDSFTVHADSDVCYNTASVSGDILLLQGNAVHSFNFVVASLASEDLMYASPPPLDVRTLAAGDGDTLFYGFISQPNGIASVDAATGKVTASTNFTEGQLRPAGMVYFAGCCNPLSTSSSQGTLVVSSGSRNGGTTDFMLVSYNADLQQLWSLSTGTRRVRPVGVIRGPTDVVVAFSATAWEQQPNVLFVHAGAGFILASVAMEVNPLSLITVNSAVLINTAVVYSVSPQGTQVTIACVVPSLYSV